MLSKLELRIFEKMRELMASEDTDIKHCGLICELYANGYKDGCDFHISPQDWDDIISNNPSVRAIVEKWRIIKDNI